MFLNAQIIDLSSCFYRFLDYFVSKSDDFRVFTSILFDFFDRRERRVIENNVERDDESNYRENFVDAIAEHRYQIVQCFHV